MERVSTLLKKLQQQLNDHSSAQSMLHTVHILHAELMSQLDKKTVTANERVAIIMPPFSSSLPVHTIDEIIPEEKIVEVLQVDEKEIEEELQQIKKHSEAMNAAGSHGRPFLYDPIEEVPTLAHQDPPQEKLAPLSHQDFEYPESLNDRLKEIKIELSQTLTSTPIKDLRKAIGINDRFLFINELFRGDEAMYERSIKTIQNFSILPEAEFWIKRELKIKIGWMDSHPVVKQFDQLIRRRFS